MRFRNRERATGATAARLAAMFSAFAVLALAWPSHASALDAEEVSLLLLMNQYRATNSLGPLVVNASLDEAARWMSQDMASNNYFGHIDSLGRDTFARMNAFGYTYITPEGENLAGGVETAHAAFAVWRGSPWHNSNMLNSSFTVVGMARAYDPVSSYGWYWTATFGGQADPAPPPALLLPPPPPPPAPAPTPEPEPPPPPPAPAPAPEPTPQPTPAPTATPQATAVQAPQWEDIALELKPWWQRLMIIEGDGSLLLTISQLVGEYLELKSDGLLPK